MLHIFVPHISNRLQYTLQWIFDEQLHVPYRLYIDKLQWQTAEGVLVSYDRVKQPEAHLSILSNGILFETGIKDYAPNIQRWKHATIFFYNQPGAKVPFDIFGAIFWMLSRYEEYAITKRDTHNRFSSKSSLAQTYNFLQQPVVDEWLMHFSVVLSRLGVQEIHKPIFEFIPTYDIDIAYAYQEKNFLQNLLGGIKDSLRLKPRLAVQRWSTVLGGINDAYDNFDFLEELRTRCNLKPLYFWLLPAKNGSYDRNVDRGNLHQQALIQRLSKENIIGIHPSYQSNKNVDILQDEQSYLSNVLSQEVHISRQHYIKLDLPTTYENLLAVGITDDYSMGYADANGFRAGTSRDFLWYNLNAECTTTLRVHPFCFMEATAIFYNKHTADKAFDEWERIYYALQKVQGRMVTIFHNYTLGGVYPFAQWQSTYTKMVELATKS